MGAQWKAKGKELAANAKGRAFGKLSKDIMLAGAISPSSGSRQRSSASAPTTRPLVRHTCGW